MTKIYFEKDSEHGCSLKDWKEYMKEEGITELELFEGKIEYRTGFFWCTELQNIGESSEGCGRFFCEHYKPRNGKNGICVHSRSPYNTTEKKIILKQDERN